MLETGNYLVPQVGGETYFRKPPLINWLVAASFKIFGSAKRMDRAGAVGDLRSAGRDRVCDRCARESRVRADR